MALELRENIPDDLPLELLLKLPCFQKPSWNKAFILAAVELLRGDKDKQYIIKFIKELDREALRMKLLGDDGDWGTVLAKDEFKRSIKIKMTKEYVFRREWTVYGAKDNHPASSAAQQDITYYFILSQHYVKDPKSGKIKSNDKGYKRQSASSFLSLLRDKMVHGGDMPPAFKAALGFFTENGHVNLDAYIKFINMTFPNLLNFYWLKFHALGSQTLRDYYYPLKNKEDLTKLYSQMDNVVELLISAVNRVDVQGTGSSKSASINYLHLPTDCIEKRLDSSAALLINIYPSSLVSSWYSNLKVDGEPSLDGVTNFKCKIPGGAPITTLLITRMEHIVTCMGKLVTFEDGCNVVVCTSKNDFHLALDNLKITKTGGLSLLAVNFAAQGASTLFLALMKNLSKELLTRYVKAPTKFLQTATSKSVVKKIQGLLKPEEFKNLFPGAESFNWDQIKLIRDTIPAPYIHYIPRVMLKRLLLNTAVFTKKCRDIFIFMNIGYFDLSQHIDSQQTVSSSSYIEEMTSSARFIILEAAHDWEEIREQRSAPAHLIKFENGQFFVEETTGDSLVLLNYLQKSNTMDKESELSGLAVTEEQFIHQVVKNSGKNNGYCICDSPGKGKTLLLASLARSMEQFCPEKIVSFIRLSDLMQIMESDHGLSEVKDVVLKYLSTSPIANAILTELHDAGILHLKIFLDGLDEVPQQSTSKALKMLSGLKKVTNTQIFVTSRPHLRQELESSLGAISYDIHAFSKNNRKEFLVKIWKENDGCEDSKRLSEFADFCIESCERRYNRSSDEQDVTGIPLLCNLIAKVYAKRAKRYCTSTENVSLYESFEMEHSLPQLYREYVCESLERCNTFNQTSAKNYHIWIALKTIFPVLSVPFAEEFEIDTKTETPADMFSAGLLEVRFSESGKRVVFVHKTFAEFMTASFLLAALENDQEIWHWTPHFREIVFRFLRIQMVTRKYKYHYVGRKFTHFEPLYSYSVVAYFINHSLREKKTSWFTENHQHLKTILTYIPYPYTLRYLLSRFTFHRHNGLVRLMISLFTNVEFDQNLEHEWWTQLIETAAEYNNLSIVKEIVAFLSHTFKYNVTNECKKWPLTKLLIIAFRKGDFELISYFLNMAPVKGKNVFAQCVFDTNNLTSEIRLDIFRLLLSKNPKSLEEVDFSSPFYDRISIHASGIKWLIEQGVDLLSPAWRGGAILLRSLENAANKDVNDICRLIIERGQCNQAFAVVTKGFTTWRSGLHYILAKRKKVELRTIKLIVNYCDKSLLQVEDFINSLIVTALGTNQSHEVLDVLFKYHPKCNQLPKGDKTEISYLSLLRVDRTPLDNCGVTFLELVTNSYSPQEYDLIITFLHNNGKSYLFHQQTSKDKSLLHAAVSSMEVYESTLRLFLINGINLNVADKYGHKVLKFAVNSKRSVNFLKMLIDMGAEEGDEEDWEGTLTFQLRKSYCTRDYVEVINYINEKGIVWKNFDVK